MKKIKFEKGAFNHELLPIIGTDKLGWYSEDHEKLVDALLPRLCDEEGKHVDLKGKKDLLKVILCPTEDLQRKVLKQTFKDAGYEMDSSTEEAFVLLFNVMGFGDYLVHKENPKTKKPFITKPKKGKKKKTFDSLMAEEPSEPETESTESQEQETK
jgi:hypothetical protein